MNKDDTYERDELNITEYERRVQEIYGCKQSLLSNEEVN